MNLRIIRQALADTFATTGLRSYTSEKENLNPPGLLLALAGINYVDTLDGECRVQFHAIILLSAADVARSIDALNDYLTTTGTKSLAAAVEADPTLGDEVSSASVTQVEDVGMLEVAGTDFVGARVLVDVIP